MSTLSDEVRELTHFDLDNGVHVQLADEVAALEARLESVEYNYKSCLERAQQKEPAPITPVDKLNQGYERAGLSSALVVNNKYGKHSAFGYMGRE